MIQMPFFAKKLSNNPVATLAKKLGSTLQFMPELAFWSTVNKQGDNILFYASPGLPSQETINAS